MRSIGFFSFSLPNVSIIHKCFFIVQSFKFVLLPTKKAMVGLLYPVIQIFIQLSV